MDNQIFDHGETVYDSTSETTSTKEITTFYFVKHHPYDDIELEDKIKKANLKIDKKNEEIRSYNNDLKQYRKDQQHANWQLTHMTNRHEGIKWLIDFKKEYLFHVQNALDTKCTYNTVTMQSPEVKALTKLISRLKHKAQREGLTLRKEKELIKEMKEFEQEKTEVVSVVSSDNKKKQDEVVQQCRSHKYKEIPIEKLVQVLTEEIDGLKATQIDGRNRIRYLTDYLKDLGDSITCLEHKLDAATSERGLANKLNACYYSSHGVTESAKQLAAMKDKAELAELSNHEMEEFFSQWSGNEIFRKEYQKRMLRSLERRGLSKDGRIKDPDHESMSPIVQESLIL